MTNRDTLKQWFIRGARPLASQFAEWIDSFVHKDDAVPAGKVDGLQEALDAKASAEALNSVNADLQTHKTDDATHADIRTLIAQANQAIIDGDAATLASAMTAIGNAVSAHNTASTAHDDIRTLITQANQAIIDGDAATLASAMTAIGNAVSTHNTATTAHGDIRGDIADLLLAVASFKGRGGYLTAYDFGAATPSQQQITDYALSEIGQTDPTAIWNGTHVKNLANSHVWALVNTPDTEPPVFEWVDDGFDSISPANGESLGVIKSGGDINMTAGVATLKDTAVYSWARQSAKPSYSYSEISGTPTSLPANGGNADYATTAGSATSATTAGYATTAGSAPANGGNADYATTAGSAPANGGNADYATTAGSATSATTAGYATTAGSAPADGGNADTTDGYHATQTANTANTIPVRDANGYINFGWINTISGDMGTSLNGLDDTHIYLSADDYIRYRKARYVYVGRALYADSAGSASTAGYATTAGSATSASTAGYATTAGTVTVGGTLPSNPNNGDIYIQT